MESLSISSFGRGSLSLSGAITERILPRDFYSRDTITVARELLGKILIVRSRTGFTAGRIVETEAYKDNDPAAHCSRGETPRCSVMFGPPGVAYVYFIYGMYEMLNFVTEPKGRPGAVLIRALQPLDGETLMRKRTKKHLKVPARELMSGPGRLTRAMGIKMRHNGEELSGPSLFVLEDGFLPSSIKVSPRVGISGGKDFPWRYFVGDNEFVSKVRENRLAVTEE